ncbi:MAG: hypothetical protein KGL39_31530 [Patescibacteria group bacterium]|nr:hypothetical protein [Patescibacteria group bacterium]
MSDNTQGLDPDFAAMLSAPPSGVQPQPPPNTQGLDPDFAQALQAQEAVKPTVVQQGRISNIPEPKPGWTDGLHAITDRLKLGLGGLSRSIVGLKLATGVLPFEEAQKEVETHDLLQAQMRTDDYEKTHAFWHIGSLWGHPDESPVSGADLGGGWLLQQIPQLGVGLAGGLIGGAITRNPRGGAVGAGLAFGLMAAGNTQYDMMQRGADITTARVAALSSGVAAGALSMISAGDSLEVAPNAMKIFESSPEVKQALVQLGGRIAKNLGVQVGSSLLQSVVQSVINFMASKNTKRPYTGGEALRDLMEAGATTAVTAPAISGAMAGAGHLGSEFSKTDHAMRALQAVIDRNAEQEFQKQLAAEEKLKVLQGHVEVSNAEAVVADRKAGRTEALAAAHEQMRADRVKQLIEKNLDTTPIEESPEQQELRQKVQEKLAEVRKPGKKASQAKNDQAALDEAAKAERAAADKAAKKAKEAKKAHAKQQAKVDTIANKHLPPAQRRLIIKAGIAARAMPGVSRAVLKAIQEGAPESEVQKAATLSEKTHEIPGAIKNKKKNKLDRATIYLDTAGHTLAGLLRYVFSDAPPDQVEDLVAALDVDKAANKAANNRRIYNELIHVYLQEATGLKRAEVEKLVHKAANTQISGEFSNGKTFHLSADQAMSYILWSENADAQAALYSENGNGFPRDFELTLTDAIKGSGADGQKMLDALDGLRGFYDEMGVILKDAHDRATGGDLPLQQNYGGTIYRQGSRERLPEGLTPFMPGEEVTQSGPGVQKDTIGEAKERGASEDYIEPRGAFLNAAQHGGRVAQYEAMILDSRFWDALLKDPDFRQGVVTKYGDRTLQMIENRYMDAVHGVPAAQKAHAEVIDNIMRANRVRVLGANPLYTAMHWFTISNFFLARYKGRRIPSGSLAEGMLDYWLNRDKANKEILSWPEVQTRYTDANNLGGIASGEAHPTISRFEQWAMKQFELGDKPALAWGSWAVYQHVLNMTGDPAAAKTAAVEAFQNVLTSGSAHQWTDVTTNPKTKGLVQFKQPELRLRQHGKEAKLRAEKYPTAENVKDALATEAIARFAAVTFRTPQIAYHMVEAAITHNPTALSASLLRAGKTAVLGNMFPLLGDAAEMLADHVVSKSTGLTIHSHEASMPVLDSVNAAGKLSGDVFSDKPWSMHRVIRTICDGVQLGQASGYSIPTAPLEWIDTFFGRK